MIVTIIGIGLIGGSLAITLKENGFAETIIGVDKNEESINKALRRKIIDETYGMEEAISRAQLVIVAVPVDAMIKILPNILDAVTNQVVIDVGSTKEIVLEKIKEHPNRRHFVATHPMAGTEFSGVEAAIPNLFDHKFTVICNANDSAAVAVELVEKMYQSIPMNILYLNAEAHDVHTAYVSHISHISSFALALTVLEKEKDEERIFELASTGFGSTVRLAKSSPETWIPIFKQNRDNVLDVLDEHINTLSRFRTLLIKRDFEKLKDLIAAANDIKRILKGRKI